jgi:2-dehydro-3-deoxyphosphogluconate aldolase/(4S)-4-hydroxy-2-oxoglutarate aldolase
MTQSESIVARIEKGGVIPVIALDNAADAVPLCRALAAGGLQVAEITFRTAAAREALSLVAGEFPDFALGAGTVTRVEEVEAAKSAGAQFAVAPGFNPTIVRKAHELDLPFFPGVCTPSDIEAALECGCEILKFFPAEQCGGLKMIQALYGPYKHRGVRFVPTGGVDADNLAEYLAHPAVIAVGGSWLVAAPLIKAKSWDEITRLTREALRHRGGV